MWISTTCIAGRDRDESSLPVYMALIASTWCQIKYSERGVMKRSKSAIRSRGSFILLLAFALPTLLGPRVLAQSQEASSADYDVYSAFLNTQLAGHNGIDDLRIGDRAGVLAPVTITFTASSLLQRQDMKHRLRGLQDSTLDSFEKCRSDSLSVSKSFSINVPYDVASRDDVVSVETFISRYPENHCLIYFSCVGFNQNDTQALFVTERGLCHSGVQEHILMKKGPSGTWQLQDVSVDWIQ